jgi:hypothetical protein
MVAGLVTGLVAGLSARVVAGLAARVVADLVTRVVTRVAARVAARVVTIPKEGEHQKMEISYTINNMPMQVLTDISRFPMVTMQNEGQEDIFLGTAASMTVDNGYRLAPGDVKQWTEESELWALTRVGETSTLSLQTDSGLHIPSDNMARRFWYRLWTQQTSYYSPMGILAYNSGAIATTGFESIEIVAELIGDGETYAVQVYWSHVDPDYGGMTPWTNWADYDEIYLEGSGDRHRAHIPVKAPWCVIELVHMSGGNTGVYLGYTLTWRSKSQLEYRSACANDPVPDGGAYTAMEHAGVVGWKGTIPAATLWYMYPATGNGRCKITWKWSVAAIPMTWWVIDRAYGTPLYYGGSYNTNTPAGLLTTLEFVLPNAPVRIYLRNQHATTDMGFDMSLTWDRNDG